MPMPHPTPPHPAPAAGALLEVGVTDQELRLDFRIAGKSASKAGASK